MSLYFLWGGGVYADGGRFGLGFGRVIISVRFAFEFGGRFAPEFCRSFCGLRASCRGWRFSRLCSCLCCCCCCCLCCCFGGLSSCRLCAQVARGPCSNAGTASAPPIPSAINHPANWSFNRIFLLHLLILIRVSGLTRLHRLRQVAQRCEIRNHIIIFQHLHILIDLLDVRCTQRGIRGPRTQPHHRQQQHRSRKRHSRRWSEPRPPVLLRRLRRHARMHAHIKRRRRLDHLQLFQQPAHRADVVHAHPAHRAPR